MSEQTPVVVTESTAEVTAEVTKKAKSTKGTKRPKKVTPKVKPGVIAALIDEVGKSAERTDLILKGNYKQNLINKIKLQADESADLRLAKGVSKPLKWAHLRRIETSLKRAALKAVVAGRNTVDVIDTKDN